jgi:hypothetical protein
MIDPDDVVVHTRMACIVLSEDCKQSTCEKRSPRLLVAHCASHLVLNNNKSPSVPANTVCICRALACVCVCRYTAKYRVIRDPWFRDERPQALKSSEVLVLMYVRRAQACVCCMPAGIRPSTL